MTLESIRNGYRRQTTWQGEDMAACRDGTEEMMSKKPEERLNILPTSFALQMSSQKKRTRIAANRLCLLETRIAGCYRLDSKSIFSQLDRFVHYPRTLFRS
jgi:hypothetical protein